jgi:uncharacterized protein (DUF1778 family)
MGASTHDIAPSRERRLGRIGFRTTAEESLLIHKAAELQGWTVTQFVLCAVLDRAERDLYEHATRVARTPARGHAANPEAAAEALQALTHAHAQ